MRCYLPGTAADLSVLVAEPGTTHRGLASLVTSELRAVLPDEDDEGLEMSAYLTAADLSVLRIAAVDEPVAPLRVVLAVEVPADALDPRLAEPGIDEPESVRMLAAELPSLGGTVTFRLNQVVAVHADDPRDETVKAMVREASRGSEEALEALGEIDLLWFAPEEIESVAAILESS